jgi:hypothetical protein
MPSPRFATFLLIFTLSALSIYAQQQAPVQQPQPTPVITNKPSSETILSKTVVLVSTSIQGENRSVSGTGFLVTVQDDRLPANGTFGYLVTNRHVAEAIFKDATGQCRSHPVQQTIVTMNLKTPINGDRTARVLLSPFPVRWYLPEDPGIDLAVLPFNPPDQYEVASVALTAFLTPDLWTQFNVTPGDKLLTTGFFRHYTGVHQFQPIIREGSLAMVPDDAMPSTPCDAPAHVYLADVHVIPGNSGSPMFLGPKTFLGGLVTPSNGAVPYLLLGVVSGYMYEDSDLTLRTSTDYEAIIHANSGITIVVPAEQLKALLLSLPLQALRDQAVATLNPKK